MKNATKRPAAALGAALFALAGTLAAAAIWWFGDAAPPSTEAPPGIVSSSWSASEGERIDLGFTPSGGPVWKRTRGEPIPLTPELSSSEPLEWALERTERGLLLSARTDLWNGELVVRWSFPNGDPQATLGLRLTGVSLEQLRDNDLRATLRLPAGTLRVLDSRLARIERPLEDGPVELDAWSPLWLEWHGAEADLALSGWNGDGVRVRRADDGAGIAVDLFVWRHAKHPALKACSSSEDSTSTTVDLGASLTASFGAAPAVVPWRLARNQLGAVVPIFDTPDSHPDSTLHRTRTNGPGDWTARATTLAYGHSNHDDPRYGNGGLLGHGLGGTVVAPAKWAGEDRVTSFRDEIRGTALGVAIRNGDMLATGMGVEASESPPSCAALADSGEPSANVIADELRPFRGRFDGNALHSPHGPTATAAAPLRLDGTRPDLVGRALGSDVVGALADSRHIGVFSTPLIGSRDPTIPAARESLLSPERNGEWTLASPFAAALASLELLRERRPVAVTDLAGIVRHWRRARRVRLRWTSEGALLARNGGDASVDGYTLVVDGAHVPSESLKVRRRNPRPSDGADAGHSEGNPPVDVVHRDGPDGGGPPRTWISWSLQPEATYRIEFGPALEDLSTLGPVDWNLKR